jgi:hypothetical protein
VVVGEPVGEQQHDARKQPGFGQAEQALASGSPANNPRVPGKDEIMALYQEVWTGAPRNI